MILREQGYGVLIDGQHGSFLAHGVDGRYFARKYFEAHAYLRELKTHLKHSRCKVVKLTVTYRVIPRKARRKVLR